MSPLFPSLPVRTERLLLRSVRVTDWEDLFAILRDAEVMRLAPYERALTRDEARQFIDDFAKDPGDVIHLGVLCRAQGESLLGFAGLLPCRYFPGDLEMGFVLATKYHGKGYATEIGATLIDLAFRALCRDRLLALCSPRNNASRRVLEKLRMVPIDEITTEDRGQRMVYEIVR